MDANCLLGNPGGRVETRAMRMTLGPEAGKQQNSGGKHDGMYEGRRKITNRATWKEKELDYIVAGADMAPFIREESNEQETGGLIAPSDHTAVMARFDMSKWGLTIQD